jgi:hypothetical protein
MRDEMSVCAHNLITRFRYRMSLSLPTIRCRPWTWYELGAKAMLFAADCMLAWRYANAWYAVPLAMLVAPVTLQSVRWHKLLNGRRIDLDDVDKAIVLRELRERQLHPRWTLASDLLNGVSILLLHGFVIFALSPQPAFMLAYGACATFLELLEAHWPLYSLEAKK